MKSKTRLAWALSAVLLAACQTPLVRDVPDEENEAPVAVKRFVAAHKEVLRELTDIKSTGQQTLSVAKDTLSTAQATLAVVEEMARRHGTGEITVFFPVGGANLQAPERERLVHFADFLSREARGRKLLLLSIGSASAFGDARLNLKLAEKRSQQPTDVFAKYLINVPHEFHQVYGTGDMYSPKGVSMKEHERYQSARVIVVFQTAQLPANLPAKR